MKQDYDEDTLYSNSRYSPSFVNFKGFYDIITAMDRYLAQSRANKDYSAWLEGLDMLFVKTEPWWDSAEDIKLYEEGYAEATKKLRLLDLTKNPSDKRVIERKLFFMIRDLHRLLNKNTRNLQVKGSDSDNDEDIEAYLGGDD